MCYSQQFSDSLYFLCRYDIIQITCTFLLAGSTFVGPIARAADWTVLDAVLVALTLTDEFEDDLHLLCKSQGLDFNDLRLALFGTALRCHTDAKRDLGRRI